MLRAAEVGRLFHDDGLCTSKHRKLTIAPSRSSLQIVMICFDRLTPQSRLLIHSGCLKAGR